MSYIRNGQLVWPYCTKCGRRLHYDLFDAMVQLVHFWVVPENACENRYETWYMPREKFALIFGV